MNSKNIEALKEQYPVGSRVELLSNMEDPYGQGRKAGDKATVKFIDDIGQIHVSWDNGSSLALVPGIDRFRKI